MNEMQKQVTRWLADGETGASSKTMAFVIAFDEVPERVNYPLDVSDLRRCIGFLKQVPQARKYLDKMKEVSPVWASLVDYWEELEALYAEEAGQSKMPKTYALLKKAIANDPNRIDLGNGISISF